MEHLNNQNFAFGEMFYLIDANKNNFISKKELSYLSDIENDNQNLEEEDLAKIEENLIEVEDLTEEDY